MGPGAFVFLCEFSLTQVDTTDSGEGYNVNLLIDEFSMDLPVMEVFKVDLHLRAPRLIKFIRSIFCIAASLFFRAFGGCDHSSGTAR